MKIKVLLIILLKDVVLGHDYCQSSLCQDGAKHVGCGANDNFGPRCPTERLLVAMTADTKAYLLKKHNQARLDIAHGKVDGYDPANKMFEMVRLLLLGILPV